MLHRQAGLPRQRAAHAGEAARGRGGDGARRRRCAKAKHAAPRGAAAPTDTCSCSTTAKCSPSGCSRLGALLFGRRGGALSEVPPITAHQTLTPSSVRTHELLGGLLVTRGCVRRACEAMLRTGVTRMWSKVCLPSRPASLCAGVCAPHVHGGHQWRGLARAGPMHDGQVLSAGVLSRKLEELGARAQAMQQACR